MKYLKCLLVALIFSLSSCSLSPCDCAKASVIDDYETIKKCDKMTSKMSMSELTEFNKKLVDCISRNNYLGN